MLSLENVKIKIDENNSLNVPNISFTDGLNKISGEEENVFKVLSFAFSSLEEGNITIGERAIKTNEELSQLIVFKINVADYASLLAVFSVNEETKNRIKNDLFPKIKELKTLGNETLLDKENKFKKLLALLTDYQASYLLLDGNLSSNKANEKSIKVVLLNSSLISIYLEAKEEKIIPEIKKEKTKKKEKAQPIIRENISFKTFFRNNWTDFLFLLIFSCLTYFSFYVGVGLILEKGNTLSILSLIVGIFCFFVSLYLCSSSSKSIIKVATNHKEKIIFNLFIPLSSLLGILISFVICFLLSKTNTFLPISKESAYALAISSTISIVLLLLTFFASFLFKAFETIKTRLKKHF